MRILIANTTLPILCMLVFLSGCSEVSNGRNAASRTKNGPKSEWFVFLATPMPKKMQPSVQTELQNLVASTATSGDVIHFVESPTHAPIARLTVPDGNPKARLRKRQVASQIKKLGCALDASLTDKFGEIGQVQFADLPNTLASLRTTDLPVRIVLVGDPIYHDPKHDGWSMMGGFVPTDQRSTSAAWMHIPLR